VIFQLEVALRRALMVYVELVTVPALLRSDLV
jgi:hypothetical protein